MQERDEDMFAKSTIGNPLSREAVWGAVAEDQRVGKMVSNGSDGITAEHPEPATLRSGIEPRNKREIDRHWQVGRGR